MNSLSHQPRTKSGLQTTTIVLQVETMVFSRQVE